MKQLKNEKGIALVTALCFTLISLGIVMMLLYIVTQGTKVTAASKRYKSTLEASYGAVALLQKDIIPRMMNFTSATNGPLGLRAFTVGGGIMPTAISTAKSDCLYQKINKTTWSAACDPSTEKDTSAKVSPDMRFNLKSTNDLAGYNVYTKIVDTRCGGDSTDPCSNSDPNSGGVKGLEKGEGSGGKGQSVSSVSKPAYYRIEVMGERASNAREKSELTVLYAY
jgi:hypothetical protein